MTKPALRLRLLGRLVATQSIGGMDAARLAKAQARTIGHNPVTDLLFGRVAEGVALEERSVQGAEGPLPVRVYRSAQASTAAAPMIVNFHGGGWVLGGLNSNDWVCSRVAAIVGAVVVSVDYRLAPGHPFPAAPEDCYAALVDIAGRAAEFGGDPTRLAVMGDSAGANLAAVVALMARDRSGPAIAHQALVVPATDLTLSSPSVEENAHAPVLTKPDVILFRGHYLGQQDPRDPLASPLFAEDHAGLPPALIQVVALDPLRDDGVRYAQALEAAGIAVRLTTYTGQPHGFMSFPVVCRQAATQALAELCQEQIRYLIPAG